MPRSPIIRTARCAATPLQRASAALRKPLTFIAAAALAGCAAVIPTRVPDPPPPAPKPTPATGKPAGTAAAKPADKTADKAPGKAAASATTAAPKPAPKPAGQPATAKVSASAVPPAGKPKTESKPAPAVAATPSVSSQPAVTQTAAADGKPAPHVSPTNGAPSNSLLPSVTVIIPRKLPGTSGTADDAGVTIQLPAEDPVKAGSRSAAAAAPSNTDVVKPAAAGEKTVAKPSEKSGEKAPEKPLETASTKPAEKPKSAETAAVPEATKPAAKPAEKPAEKPSEKPATVAAEPHADKASELPPEPATEKPTVTTSGAVALQRPVETTPEPATKIDAGPAVAVETPAVATPSKKPEPTTEKPSVAILKKPASESAPVVPHASTGAPANAVVEASATNAPQPPAVPASAPPPAPVLSVISEAEQRQLAAIPLPRLPTLVKREGEPAETVRESPAPATAPATRAEPRAPTSAGTNDPGVPSPHSPGDGETSTSRLDLLRAQLSLASDRTGLTEDVLNRVRDAQRLIDAGNLDVAQTRLDALNKDLDAAFTTVTATRGESLWQIAGKPEAYNNSYLWPLIWHANMPKLEHPWSVQRGQTLRVPKYPRLQDVSEALEYAHTHGPDGRKPN